MRLLKFVVAAVLILLIPKVGVSLYAHYKRHAIQQEFHAAGSPSEGAVWFASWLAQEWQHDTDPKPIWRRLRQAMPKPFKPDRDATAFLALEGPCNQMVRAAQWALDGAMPTDQHDIITPHTAHSAISVQVEDGRWVLLDPFLGLIFRDQGRLLGLEDVIARARDGKGARNYAVPLVAKPDFELYDEVARAAHARMPAELNVTIPLPVTGERPLALGAIDGETRDTQLAAKRLGLTTHFFYVGPRYSRKFRFNYTLPDDGRTYEIAFHLTKDVTASELPEFSVEPTIGEDSLRFRMTPDKRALTIDSSDLDLDEWYGLDRVEITPSPADTASN